MTEPTDTTPEPARPPARPMPERSHPVGHIMQFFKSSHLPPHLAEVAESFEELAGVLAMILPMNPELTVALRKLLESKDAAVRAVIAGG